MYLLKVGDWYVGSDGQLTMRQSEAMRVDLQSGQSLRTVKLRPRGQLNRPSVSTLDATGMSADDRDC